MPLIMHETSYGAPTVHGTENNIYVGKYCSIANSAVFDGGMGHNHRAVTSYPLWRLGYCDEVKKGKCKGDIYVGNDVWIGDGALIMSGVTIGDGAVIGARAVVRENIDPYEIYLGFRERLSGPPLHPHIRYSRPKKYRFEDSTIISLLTLCWWDWPAERIRQNAHLLLSENIEAFLKVNEGVT